MGRKPGSGTLFPPRAPGGRDVVSTRSAGWTKRGVRRPCRVDQWSGQDPGRARTSLEGRMTSRRFFSTAFAAALAFVVSGCCSALVRAPSRATLADAGLAGADDQGVVAGVRDEAPAAVVPCADQAPPPPPGDRPPAEAGPGEAWCRVWIPPVNEMQTERVLVQPARKVKRWIAPVYGKRMKVVCGRDLGTGRSRPVRHASPHDRHGSGPRRLVARQVRQ